MTFLDGPARARSGERSAREDLHDGQGHHGAGCGQRRVGSRHWCRPARVRRGRGVDPTFGTGGTELAGPGGNADAGLVGDAALQANGDIVVSGSFGLARFLPKGRLDTGFGVHGVAGVGFGSNFLAAQPNGEFIAAGENTSGQVALARVTASGTRDRSFGHGGVVTTAFPDATFGASAGALLVEQNGDILAGPRCRAPAATSRWPCEVRWRCATPTARWLRLVQEGRSPDSGVARAQSLP